MVPYPESWGKRSIYRSNERRYRESIWHCLARRYDAASLGIEAAFRDGMEGSEQLFSESPPESNVGLEGCPNFQAVQPRYSNAAYNFQLKNFELLVDKTEEIS